MIGDAAIHVWLDSDSHTRPSIITPYVQTPEEKVLQYRVDVRRSGRSGTSSLSQGGTVKAFAKTPAALGRFSLTVAKEDECVVTLTLTDGGIKVGEYHFDCPR